MPSRFEQCKLAVPWFGMCPPNATGGKTEQVLDVCGLELCFSQRKVVIMDLGKIKGGGGLSVSYIWTIDSFLSWKTND